eukprot:TRINITY_DN3130_c0_g1_i1.p1 TRINITY_DN3130_c0_g1~~TRINITY_DN3130_c0_g1_i1.p1  ORF type:complete len:210 (-),score=45.01 TRINITY_DN3130_c0_g1_i1:103-732(-)
MMKQLVYLFLLCFVVYGEYQVVNIAKARDFVVKGDYALKCSVYHDDSGGYPKIDVWVGEYSSDQKLEWSAAETIASEPTINECQVAIAEDDTGIYLVAIYTRIGGFFIQYKEVGDETWTLSGLALASLPSPGLDMAANDLGEILVVYKKDVKFFFAIFNIDGMKTGSGTDSVNVTLIPTNFDYYVYANRVVAVNNNFFIKACGTDTQHL